VNDGRHAEAGNQRTTSRSSSCRPSRRFPRHSLLHREVTKSHFERPASNTIAQNPLRGDARGTMRCALLMAKGSLFLGRLTELSDGVSVLLEAAS